MSTLKPASKVHTYQIPSVDSVDDSAESLAALLQQSSSTQQLDALKGYVLGRLNGIRRVRIVGLEEEYKKVHQLVEQTVIAGEGNSMVIIGARGSGKTTLVENVISDLSLDHKDDYHVVRLNGFIHTDDKLALREIWRQLNQEMEVEDISTTRTSSYADTLSSLLALLSHPGELAESDADQTAKSVIFILDEFDLFTSHPRQTLLYNLFDIAQSRKAPITVLGLTTKIDVAESLEKRVKSRFSHRFVHLSLPKTLLDFWNVCSTALLVQEEDVIGSDGRLANDLLSPKGSTASIASSWEEYVDVRLLLPSLLGPYLLC